MTTTITPDCKITYAASIEHDMVNSSELSFGWYAKKVSGETDTPKHNSRYIGFTTHGTTCWYKIDKPTFLRK